MNVHDAHDALVAIQTELVISAAVIWVLIILFAVSVARVAARADDRIEEARARAWDESQFLWWDEDIQWDEAA